MPTARIRVSIFINYFLFAVLLNSVGTVILQMQHYFKLTQVQSSVLEGFKDLSIAFTSFIVASFIARIGYKRSMLLALAMVSIACFIVPFVKTVLAIKLLFAITGASFALIKVSVFGTIGLISADDKAHISTMNFIEAFFMAGILSGYLLFGKYIDDTNNASADWFNVYFILGSLALIAFFLLLSAPLDERAAVNKNGAAPVDDDVLHMFQLLLLPLVVSFIVCAFVYVLIEQSIMSWLPTFNNKVLQLPSSISVQMAGILAAATGLGRFLAGIVLKKFDWYIILIVCLGAAALLVCTALPLAANSPGQTITGWSQVPVAAYVFPFIGFFLAPVYPAINSSILAALPKERHGAMAGWIVVFSALGGTLGSIVTGFIFQHYGGKTAFYFSLIPITILVLLLTVFRKFKKQNDALNG